MKIHIYSCLNNEIDVLKLEPLAQLLLMSEMILLKYLGLFDHECRTVCYPLLEWVLNPVFFFPSLKINNYEPKCKIPNYDV